MEFTGSILFADESQWLTLTTDTDDEVTVKVSFTQISGGETVALTFAVTPNSGVTRLPAGEILRALIDGGGSAVTGYFQATQGDSSCIHSFKVFPCRKFDYTNLYTAVFCTRPTESPAYEGGKDTLSFYNSTYGSTSAYVRFRYSGGGVSSDYSLYVPISTRVAAMHALDVSRDTMLSVAANKGLTTADIAGYDIWIEYSGSKSETYSFGIRRSRLPLRTYKFLGRRGTYEYIHAVGKFGRSLESETRVFVNSGIESELENDSVMTFEQNTGHIGSAGMAAYWLEFLASKERYIVEKDGSERRIVVDEHKTTLADREVGSVTFKWHYANPNNTVIDKAEVALTGLTVTGEATVSSDGNTAQYGVIYSPSNTTQRGVTWSVVSGADYASIDQNGLLTVKAGADGSAVRIRATGRDNTSVYAEKSLTVTYKAAAVAVTGVTLGRTALSLAVGESETLVATVAPERAADRTVVWSSSAPAVATVDQTGKVTAVSAGSAVISVRTNDGGYTATCALTVAAGASITFESGSVAVAATEGTVVNKFTTSGLNDATLECAVTGGITFTSGLDILNSIEDGLFVYCKYAANSGAARTATITVTGTRTDGGGTFSKSFTIVQAAAEVDLTGLAIESDYVSDGKVNGGGIFRAVFTPSDTTQTGVTWSIVSGADYVTGIEQTSAQECTITFSTDEAAEGQTVTIRCASAENPDIFAEMTVTLEAPVVEADWSITGETSMEAVVGGTSQYGIEWGDVAEDTVAWSLVDAAYTGGDTEVVYATIDQDGLLTIGDGWDSVAWPSTLTIGVTATLGSGDSKTLEVTLAKTHG